MTFHTRKTARVPPSGRQNPETRWLFPFTPGKFTKDQDSAGTRTTYGELVMELRAVQLKVCEGCGCLWYRTQNLGDCILQLL